jgi:hypothetical protein
MFPDLVSLALFVRAVDAKVVNGDSEYMPPRGVCPRTTAARRAFRFGRRSGRIARRLEGKTLHAARPKLTDPNKMRPIIAVEYGMLGD